MRIYEGIEELESMIGWEVGVSEWMKIDQERIQLFADATSDHQWIHTDVERAERESPFSAPIAHGFLTLSLIPQLRSSIFRVEGVKAGINYGLNKVRFITPVLAGSSVRARVTLQSVDSCGKDRYLVCTAVTIELKNSDRPACVTESLGLYVM